jgi:hypothetical protein
MKSPIKTVRVKAENKSGRGKVLRVHGGTIEVPSYGQAEADILPLTQAEIDDYRERHNMIITPVRKGAKTSKDQAEKDELEKAMSDAALALEKAQESNDAVAIEAAQQAFHEAKRKLDAA